MKLIFVLMFFCLVYLGKPKVHTQFLQRLRQCYICSLFMLFSRVLGESNLQYSPLLHFKQVSCLCNLAKSDKLVTWKACANLVCICMCFSPNRPSLGLFSKWSTRKVVILSRSLQTRDILKARINIHAPDIHSIKHAMHNI